MTPTTKVTVTGAEQIAAAMRRLGNDLSDFSDENRRAAEALASAARRRAPRRTGRLAGSIRPSNSTESATVTVGARYGVPVAARNPFWQNAIRDTQTARDRLYQQKVTDSVRKANR